MSRQREKVTRRLFVVLIAVLMLLTIPQYAWGVASSPSARVVSVDHPSRVLPGEVFRVTIVVDYSDRLLADVGIWDPQTGDMVHSVTLISQFTGPGKANFAFQLTAPPTETSWNLLAITRVWWQNGWYQDPNDGAMSFTVTVSDRFTLVVSSLGAASSISLDGNDYKIGDKQQTPIAVQRGMHTLEAEQLIAGTMGERAVFEGWSDGVNSRIRRIFMTGDASIAAIYRTEYYLTIRSDVGKTSGEGWYEKDTQASFGVTPETYTISSWFGWASDEYRFSQWSGDSESKDFATSIAMDGPKTVTAQYARSQTRPDIGAVANILFLASVPLAGRVIYLRLKTRRGRSNPSQAIIKRTLILLLVTIILLASLNVPQVQAEYAFQPDASIVQIGDATWYYWNQVQSDTCILWLGGGLSQETSIGYNYYWINPYNYESFGTIHFLQDLARYYCVIALEKGADLSLNSNANRTVHQELYQIQSTFIANVHNWIKKQGYAHTFVVGYSVGGQAAAIEIALRDPTSWTSSDGLVLITVPLVTSVIDHAGSIRPNLLFLYGGNLPDFVVTGQKFFDSAPQEGWHGTYYYHKEFDVLQDAGHEVWTVRDTGEYSPTALKAVVNFIETSKVLQFGPDTNFTAQSAANPSNPPSQNLTLLNAPSKVRTGQVFFMEGVVQSTSKANLVLIAFDNVTNRLVSSMAFQPSTGEPSAIRLVMPPISNSSVHSFTVFLVEKVGDNWLRSGMVYRVNVTVTDEANLVVRTIPSSSFLFDGQMYTVPASGSVQIESSRGVHSVMAQPAILLDNVTRLLFTAWEEGNPSPQRQLLIENDTILTAFYRKQYFVNVTSAYGKTVGSGWYDENSTAAIMVYPPMPSQTGVILAHWVGDSNDNSPRAIMNVDSPKTVQASWNQISLTVQPNSMQGLTRLSLSALVFAAFLILNSRRSKSSDSKENS